MSDFEMRKKMWLTLSALFSDVDDLDFIWIYSEDDAAEANKLPDGIGSVVCSGVVRGVV